MDRVPATRLEVLIDEVLMFENSLAVVRFIVVTFVLIFNEVAKISPTVRELVKMAFPRVYKLARVPPRAVETTVVEAFTLALFMFWTNTFLVVMELLTNIFPPMYRVEPRGIVVLIPRFPEIDTIERVPVFIVVALRDCAVTELLV